MELSRCTQLRDWRSLVLEGVSSFSTIFNCTKRGDYCALIGDCVLKNQFDHLGFRNTLHFLLPLVLPESLIPSNLLASCQQLVEIRNTVVHQGQRNLDQRQIIKLIEDVREACRLLQKLTGP